MSDKPVNSHLRNQYNLEQKLDELLMFAHEVETASNTELRTTLALTGGQIDDIRPRLTVTFTFRGDSTEEMLWLGETAKMVFDHHEADLARIDAEQDKGTSSNFGATSTSDY